MIKEDIENEKDLQFIKIIACFIIYSIIGIVALFTLFVSKVNATTFFHFDEYDNAQYAYLNLNPITRGYFRGCTSANSCFSTSYGSYNDSGKLWNTSNVANDSKGLMYYVIPSDLAIYSGHYYSATALYCGSSKGSPNLYMWTGNNYDNANNIEKADDKYHTFKSVDEVVFVTTANGSTYVGCQYLYSLFVANRAGAVIGFQLQVSSATNSTTHYLVGYNIEEIDNANHLTESQVQNIINNSGLATASSINEVKTATNQVKQEVEELNEQQQETNNILNDDSIDNPNNAISGMESNNASNGVISDLLLLPVRMFQNILNNINGTCTTFNLGTLFNHNLTLPCINLADYLGNALYNVVDVLISGIFILSIRKKFVDIFENFTSLKTGGNELE